MEKGDWISIDDAGGGSLGGGLVIASMDHNTGKVLHKLIPQDHFTEGCNSFIREEVTTAVKELLKEHNAPLLPIHLCRGDVFDTAVCDPELKEREIHRGEIEKGAGDHAEDIFFDHLRQLGLPPFVQIFREMVNRDKQKAYRGLNLFIENHVLVDREGRADICKHHSVLWRRILAAEIKREEIQMVQRRDRKPRLCYNCGERIHDQKARKYVVNDRSIFYTHLDCVK